MSRHNAPPQRWNQYVAMKDVIEGTRFLPFKTPFKRPVRRESGDFESFNGSDLLKRVGNLGFVLNLVNTMRHDRYYNVQVYAPKKVEYHHERLSGGGMIPTETQISTAFEVLDHFTSRHQDDNVKLVGVHCTHGVNRTGYLICRYMIRKLGFEPREAIRRFEQGRGHPFDHEEYVEDLCSLKPAVDASVKRWHSIGGRIIVGGNDVDDDDDESFDPDELENLGRKGPREQSPQRATTTDRRHNNGRHDDRQQDDRRQDDRRQDERRQDDRRQDERRQDDRHQRRRNSSPSSRIHSRRKDRSRSPLRTSASCFPLVSRDDRRRYERDEEDRSPTSDRLWRYVGPRTSRTSLRADSYLGPPRHESMKWSRD